jgi:ribonuclease HI
MPKQKYYVVWKGRKTGVFTTWAECEKQVKGFVGAQYKAFGSEAEAEAAYLANYDDYKGKVSSSGNGKQRAPSPSFPPFAWMRLAAVHRGNWNIAV